MSRGEPTADSAPFFSSDSEAEGPEDQVQPPEEESASGVSRVRALLTVLILFYINLLNYMDRFTVAGTRLRPLTCRRFMSVEEEPPAADASDPPECFFSTGVLPDIEHYFGINDGKSGLLQTGKKNL